MQIADAAQEGMKAGLERQAGLGLLRLVVAPLQIRAGAERPPRASQHHAAHLALLLLDRVEGIGEAAQHVHGDRVHNFRMIELQDRHRAVEIERDVFELHLFPRRLLARVLCRGASGFNLPAIFDF